MNRPNNTWLRKAISQNGSPVSLSEIESHSDSWRPWRAYAAMHLWDSFVADETDPRRLWQRDSTPPAADQVA
jgi:3-methyladenine DNA glycosylase/8-oxoguanine DNA glycosylase